MFTMDTSAILGMISVASTIIGGTTWAIRLEGRQTAHELVDQRREELVDERHKDVKEALSELDRKLEVLGRIERKLDIVAGRQKPDLYP